MLRDPVIYLNKASTTTLKETIRYSIVALKSSRINKHLVRRPVRFLCLNNSFIVSLAVHTVIVVD